MGKTKKIILMVLAIVAAFSLKSNVLAAEELRDYYKVVSGTAVKLGTDEKEDLIGGYLEEWEVALNYELPKEVADVLLESSNADKLKQSENVLNYSVLKNLAEEVATTEVQYGTPVYQGYARLGLEKASEGYTFGVVVVEDEKEGLKKVTGYYAELDKNGIYKFEINCKKVPKEQIMKSLKSSSNSSSSTSSSAGDSSSGSSSTGGSSSGNSSTTTPVVRPTGRPSASTPTVPTPVIPGPTTE